MRALSNFVSLHPYFKMHPGKLEAVKAGFPRFVEKTATEEKVLFYELPLTATKFSAVKVTPMPKAFSHIWQP